MGLFWAQTKSLYSVFFLKTPFGLLFVTRRNSVGVSPKALIQFNQRKQSVKEEMLK